MAGLNSLEMRTATFGAWGELFAKDTNFLRMVTVCAEVFVRFRVLALVKEQIKMRHNSFLLSIDSGGVGPLPEPL